MASDIPGSLHSLEVYNRKNSTLLVTMVAQCCLPPQNFSTPFQLYLEQALQEYSDILKSTPFAIDSVQRHGTSGNDPLQLWVTCTCTNHVQFTFMHQCHVYDPCTRTYVSDHNHFFFHKDGCPMNVSQVRMCSSIGSVSWSETEIGDIVSRPCPCGIEDPLIEKLMGHRTCGGSYTSGAEWVDPQCNECNFTETRNDLCRLTQVSVLLEHSLLQDVHTYILYNKS